MKKYFAKPEFFSKKWIFVVSFGFLFFIMTCVLYLNEGLSKKRQIGLQIKRLNMQLIKNKNLLGRFTFNHKDIIAMQQKFFYYNQAERCIKNDLLLLLISGQLLPKRILVSALDFLPGQKSLSCIKFPVNLCVTASQEGIEEFLYQIANLPYSIYIKTFIWDFFDFLNANEKGKMTILFTIYQKEAGFWQNLRFNPSMFIEKRSFQRQACFTHFPLRQLSMVGFLSVNFAEQKWGLIGGPHGEFCKVRLGEEIGMERGHIVCIDNKKILIQRKNTLETSELALKMR
jgi:hypothetical protein